PDRPARAGCWPTSPIPVLANSDRADAGPGDIVSAQAGGARTVATDCTWFRSRPEAVVGGGGPEPSAEMPRVTHCCRPRTPRSGGGGGGPERSASSRSTRTTGRCELGGLLRQHPLRRSAATALLAPLLLRFGGSVSGADRSAEMARVNSLDHCLARARTERAGVRWPHRRRADRFFTDMGRAHV